MEGEANQFPTVCSPFIQKLVETVVFSLVLPHSVHPQFSEDTLHSTIILSLQGRTERD